MLTWLVLAAVIPSACVCWTAAWGVRRLGPRAGLIDRPGARKIHDKPMPTSGGLAIWLGLVVPLGLGHCLLGMLRAGPSLSPAVAAACAPLLEFLTATGIAVHLPGLWQKSATLWLLLGGGTVLMLLGLADDHGYMVPGRGLDWRFRLTVQTAVAAAMVGCGWCVRLPCDHAYMVPVRGVAFVVSVVWIVGLVNSFNMLDNMDGLSAGVAAIAAVILAAAALLTPRPDNQQPQLFVAGLLLLLVGSLLGFLGHNRPPARLFMGDAGSYLIGYLLAMATLTATFAGGLPRTQTGLPASGYAGALAPLCVMAVPIYDTVSVVLIRLRQRRSPFVGDKSHFSHRLVQLGMTKSQAVLTIYLATATCGLGALLLHQVDSIGALLVLLMVACTLSLVAVLESTGGSRERGAGSGEQGAGSGEQGAGSGERGAGSGERGAESGERGESEIKDLKSAES
jgi:UDP-GlcNAc:undecaprenyl-phosphate GlcNAc-1-phosphate transferase